MGGEVEGGEGEVEDCNWLGFVRPENIGIKSNRTRERKKLK